MVSIHAPVKGATYLKEEKPKTEEVSIHAPVKGATSIVFSNLPELRFQFTHP